MWVRCWEVQTTAYKINKIQGASQGNRNENKQMGPNQMYTMLYSKGNDKKTTYGMGENIC